MRRACLAHINKRYVRMGELDRQQFFILDDMTEKVEASYDDVAANIARFEEYMKQTKEPKDDIGLHCHEPYSCGFYTYCTRHLPNPNFFHIAGFTMDRKFNLYHMGLASFEDLKDSGELKEKQKLQVVYALEDRPPFIRMSSLKEFMDGLYYPMYFLDFETCNPAVPHYENSRPYQQIVFQYSLHYLESEGGQLMHKEFLAAPQGDPRRGVAERLCEDIPDNVCVLAYNMTFEKTVIKGLSNLFPDLADKLMRIHDNMQDLMYPFSHRDYYCPSMEGSYSIKNVLPALFPDDSELNYHNLEGVQNGNDASAAFMRMTNNPEQDWTELRQQLLKYCKLDTFAMVKIWQFLREVVK